MPRDHVGNLISTLRMRDRRSGSRLGHGIVFGNEFYEEGEHCLVQVWRREVGCITLELVIAMLHAACK